MSNGNGTSAATEEQALNPPDNTQSSAPNPQQNVSNDSGRMIRGKIRLLRSGQKNQEHPPPQQQVQQQQPQSVDGQKNQEHPPTHWQQVQQQQPRSVDGQKNQGHTPPQPQSVAFAFSGGGIRSAAQCAGVLEAYADADSKNPENIKIVSCVSGGGYLGSALIDHQTYQPSFEWKKFFKHFRKNHGCVLVCR